MFYAVMVVVPSWQNQYGEYQASQKLAEYQRNNDNRNAVDGLGRDPRDLARFDEKLGYVFGEIVSRKSRSQKSCQSDAYLDSGKEAVGIAHHFHHARCFFVAVARHTLDLAAVKLQYRYLRCRKKCV
jgi:opacity protein-like surface antigen